MYEITIYKKTNKKIIYYILKSNVSDSFDVVRYKKDKVKILDFGPLNESTVKNTLFTLDELNNISTDAPEFRFIAEDIGIQPKSTNQFCVPQEINEFFRDTGDLSIMEAIREVKIPSQSIKVLVIVVKNK